MTDLSQNVSNKCRFQKLIQHFFENHLLSWLFSVRKLIQKKKDNHLLSQAKDKSGQIEFMEFEAMIKSLIGRRNIHRSDHHFSSLSFLPSPISPHGDGWATWRIKQNRHTFLVSLCPFSIGHILGEQKMTLQKSLQASVRPQFPGFTSCVQMPKGSFLKIILFLCIVLVYCFSFLCALFW